MSKTYECSICYAVNIASKVQCSCCGTIPPQYSGTRKCVRILDTDFGDMINGFISVVSAIGCDRTERHRTCKRVLRTVAADYYAVED